MLLLFSIDKDTSVVVLVSQKELEKSCLVHKIEAVGQCSNLDRFYYNGGNTVQFLGQANTSVHNVVVGSQVQEVIWYSKYS